MMSRLKGISLFQVWFTMSHDTVYNVAAEIMYSGIRTALLHVNVHLYIYISSSIYNFVATMCLDGRGAVSPCMYFSVYHLTLLALANMYITVK